MIQKTKCTIQSLTGLGLVRLGFGLSFVMQWLLFRQNNVTELLDHWSWNSDWLIIMYCCNSTVNCNFTEFRTRTQMNLALIAQFHQPSIHLTWNKRAWSKCSTLELAAAFIHNQLTWILSLLNAWTRTSPLDKFHHSTAWFAKFARQMSGDRTQSPLSIATSTIGYTQLSSRYKLITPTITHTHTIASSLDWMTVGWQAVPW